MPDPAVSYSFVDRIRDYEPDGAWRVEIVPGGFRYTALQDGATLTIDRTDPHEDVPVTANTGDSVTQSGSVALVERAP